MKKARDHTLSFANIRWNARRISFSDCSRSNSLVIESNPNWIFGLAFADKACKKQCLTCSRVAIRRERKFKTNCWQYRFRLLHLILLHSRKLMQRSRRNDGIFHSWGLTSWRNFIYQFFKRCQRHVLPDVNYSTAD